MERDGVFLKGCLVRDAINFMDFFFCSELQKVIEMHVG